MVVVRGIAMYVGGAVFRDEVDAAVRGTRRGPIMLMRSSGFLPFSPLGRGCRGLLPDYGGLMLVTGVLVAGHMAVDGATMEMLTPASN